jgi:hypothetical protein
MTPASVLSISKEFHRGYELCFGNGLPADNGLKNALIPAVVCLAFSIELGLKSILLGCNKPSEGHKFVELFNKLPNEIKAEIESLVPSNGNEFSHRLAAVSNAFVEWRYIFEESGYHSIDIEFMLLLHRIITNIAERYVAEQRVKLQTGKKN